MSMTAFQPSPMLATLRGVSTHCRMGRDGLRALYAVDQDIDRNCITVAARPAGSGKSALHLPRHAGGARHHGAMTWRIDC